MSLPFAFRTTLEDVPASVSYLSAERIRAERWRRHLGEAAFKVGIAWQGSRNRIDVGRSVPLSMFGCLAAIPGVRLISLQKGAAAYQLRTAPADCRIEVIRDEFDAGTQAFLDSAAVTTHLGLIISCDTALQWKS